MTKTVKVLIITVTSVAILGALGFSGLRKFTHSIYQQRTCEWANIDNIEMHAEIDIPKIVTCDCEYKKDLNTKMARFDIDKKNVDMARYLERNNFKKLAAMTGITSADFLKIENPPTDLSSTSDLYYTKGTYQGETWQTLLDNATGRLWVTIKYKN
jgi:hypothetical protein